MIEQRSTPVSPFAREFLLRPNRSMSARGLAVFFTGLATVAGVVSVVSAGQGNWFAPAFAAAVGIQERQPFPEDFAIRVGEPFLLGDFLLIDVRGERECRLAGWPFHHLEIESAGERDYDQTFELGTVFQRDAVERPFVFVGRGQGGGQK